MNLQKQNLQLTLPPRSLTQLMSPSSRASPGACSAGCSMGVIVVGMSMNASLGVPRGTRYATPMAVIAPKSTGNTCTEVLGFFFAILSLD